MASQAIYVYKEEDYQGEFNLISLEKRIMVRELTKTQYAKRAAVLLNFSERSMERKMKAHQIQLKDWKKSK